MTRKSANIPLFPLNIFLLPGEQLPLHIFEPRYQQLFNEAKHEDLTFGLPLIIKEKGISLVSECKLVQVTKEYDNGESDVIVEAVEVGELLQYNPVYEGKLYPGGRIAYRNDFNLDLEAPDELLNLFREHIRLKFGNDQTYRQVAHYRLLDVAASIAMSNEDKVKLLTAECDEQRLKLLVNNLRYINLLHLQENSIENGFILN
jgi:hypothetical protein